VGPCGRSRVIFLGSGHELPVTACQLIRHSFESHSLGSLASTHETGHSKTVLPCSSTTRTRLDPQKSPPFLAGMNSTPASSRTRRLYSPPAKTFLTGWRIDFAPRLDRLSYFGKSSASTSRAFDFCHNFFSFRSLHKNHLLEIRNDPYAKLAGTRSTCLMSLCSIDDLLPSSQAMVTPFQVVLVTVPRSVVVAPQRTRSPTLRSRDCSPVMLCANNMGNLT
jgi:hypothetical protein